MIPLSFEMLNCGLGFEADGLHIVRGGESQNSIGKRDNRAEQLVQHGTLEVTRHWIAAEKHFYLDAADEWAGFEFIYVLSGNITMELDDRKEDLHSGDYLHHRGLPERAFFRVNTDVELLMVSSPPSYHLVREEIQGILELARTVEEKDEVTQGHLDRLERLASMTGERLGLSGQRLIDLSYAAYLHDIGKVKIPDEILNKNGPLNDEERIVMQTHTTRGGEMLADHEFLSNASKAVVSHHENFDGSGYPEGLKGDEIPIEARVIRVVDTYDAITSARPYQGALSKEEAIRELVNGVDKQFDRRVVSAFIEVVSDGMVDNLGD